ncbi:MAG: hypothetical protein RDV48_29920 [Candidatus Eremiobacteraeota bacterium]|nr:hypothetical protein [Candidatus Eremiobacteraeota bacterium]
MDVIRGVLVEELENSLRIRERYLESLRALPRGSLRKKHINGHDYYYLAFREGRKVKYSYLGKLSESRLREYEEGRRKRDEQKKAVKKLDQQIRYLRKAINVRAD